MVKKFLHSVIITKMKTYSIMYWLYYNQIFLFLNSNNKFYQDIDRDEFKTAGITLVRNKRKIFEIKN